MSHKSDMKPALVQDNPWQQLRRYTDARIALGRVGDSLPTKAHLEFQLAHAKARDAVHLPLDFGLLKYELAALRLPILELASQAKDRAVYLQRPDLGRVLDADSLARVQSYSEGERCGYDVAIVVADGLSSLAIAANAKPLLRALLPELEARRLSVGPLCLVKQGRVAVGDEVCEELRAQLVILLVGERPGLSSPDSLGIYMTYRAYAGIPESRRNCLSNIRDGGMSPIEATKRLVYLVDEALKRHYSGVELKDETEVDALSLGQNFLLPSHSR
jgi:ethanolamine ammonia-lyase small subunit